MLGIYEVTRETMKPGAKFGAWMLLEYPRRTEVNGKVYTMVRAACACGLVKDVLAKNLKCGQSGSCRKCASKAQFHV